MEDKSHTFWVAISFLVFGLGLGLVATNADIFASSLNAGQMNQAALELDHDDHDHEDHDDHDHEEKAEPVVVNIEGDPFIGAEDAPVTIIEFSDFECPFCRRFYTDTLPFLSENYIENGDVKLVYKDFPLPSHANAVPSAEAAECVRMQAGNEKFFEYHDLLFDVFDEWAYKGDASEKLLTYADQIEVDIRTCMAEEKAAAEVQEDYLHGRNAGITGTPSFVINGTLYVGAYPAEVFEQIIEAELQAL